MSDMRNKNAMSGENGAGPTSNPNQAHPPHLNPLAPNQGYVPQSHQLGGVSTLGSIGGPSTPSRAGGPVAPSVVISPSVPVGQSLTLSSESTLILIASLQQHIPPP